jgi:enoyl-CoA hydratase
VAANAPLAVMASKQIVTRSGTWPVDDMFARQRPYTDPVVNSADALEGARAFAEKRMPVWSGA